MFVLDPYILFQKYSGMLITFCTGNDTKIFRITIAKLRVVLAKIYNL